MQHKDKYSQDKKSKFFQPIFIKWGLWVRWVIIIFLIFWLWQVTKHYFSNFFLDLDSLATKILIIFSTLQFSKDTFNLWGKYLITLIIFLWIIFLTFGLGRNILRWLKIDFSLLNGQQSRGVLQYPPSDVSFIEEICFSLGIGWGVLAYLSFMLGILGLLKIEFFVILFLLITILGIFEWKDFIINKKKQELNISFHKIGIINYIFIFILGTTLLINFINAFCPEIFYDSLVYHLGAPNFFIQEGKITKIPFEVHSNLPSNMAMLYTSCLILRDENLAKLIHFSFGVLTVLGIISFASRFFNLRIGIISAVIFYTVPMVAMNSWAAAVDVGLTFFELLALYALIVWMVSQDEVREKALVVRWLILSAIFSGLALGTKYTALFCFLMLTFLIIIHRYYARKQKINSDFGIKELLIFISINILIFLPWVLKNLYWTGDPVYPYLASLQPANVHLRRFISATREYFSSFKEYLIHPWVLTMQGNTNASFIGPVFLIFAPLLVLFRNKDRVAKILLIYLAGFWFLWSLATHMLRFFIPGLAIFSILIVIYIFKSDLNGIFKTTALLVICFLCLTNLYWTFSIFYEIGGWKVIVGDLTKENYLSYPHSGYPAPYFKVADYINKNLPSDAKILLIGECRNYYIQRKFLTHSVYDKNPVVEWVRDYSDSEGVLLSMQKENITHILFNNYEANRLQKGYKIFYWTEKELKIFDEFWKKYVRQIYDANDVYLYEIVKNPNN